MTRGRPVLLDLFCGAGGATVGYYRAGFDVIGVDVAPQPDYPCRFIQANALTVASDLAAFIDRDVAVIHASPPCQAHSSPSKGTNLGRRTYVDYIGATRELLKLTGLPWVMENVPTAPIRRDLMLCGEMFGLAVIRHRFFELSGWTIEQPEHRRHRGGVAGMRHGEWFTGPYFAVYGQGGGKGSVAQWRRAMGIDWTTDRRAIAEAIPPVYTEHVGQALMAHVTNTARAR